MVKFLYGEYLVEESDGKLYFFGFEPAGSKSDFQRLRLEVGKFLELPDAERFAAYANFELHFSTYEDSQTWQEFCQEARVDFGDADFVEDYLEKGYGIMWN